MPSVCGEKKKKKKMCFLWVCSFVCCCRWFWWLCERTSAVVAIAPNLFFQKMQERTRGEVEELGDAQLFSPFSRAP